MKPNKLTYEEYVRWRKNHTSKGFNATEVIKERKEEKKPAIEETLRIARILKANGINLSKIPMSKMINGERILILLEDIEQDGIDIQEIIEENGLDGKYKFGMKVKNLRTAYSIDRMTEEQKRETEEIGLQGKRKKSNSSWTTFEFLIDKEKIMQEAIRKNNQAKGLYNQYNQLLKDRSEDGKDTD